MDYIHGYIHVVAMVWELFAFIWGVDATVLSKGGAVDKKSPLGLEGCFFGVANT